METKRSGSYPSYCLNIKNSVLILQARNLKLNNLFPKPGCAKKLVSLIDREVDLVLESLYKHKLCHFGDTVK